MTRERDDDQADAEREITSRSLPLQHTLLTAIEMQLAGDPLRRPVAKHAIGELLARLLASEVRENPAALTPALRLVDAVRASVVEAAGASPNSSRTH